MWPKNRATAGLIGARALLLSPWPQIFAHTMQNILVVAGLDLRKLFKPRQPPPPLPPPNAEFFWPMVLAVTIAMITCSLLLVSLALTPRRRKAPPAKHIEDNRKMGLNSRRLEELQADGPIDIIVVGSGISGLTCAALLARTGKKVLVLEQHDVAGGCTHNFVEKGFEFDTGVHYVGAIPAGSGADRLLCDITAEAGPVAWAELDDEYDVAVVGEERLGMPTGKARLRAALETRFPDEKRVIDAYFDAIAEQQACAGLFFVGRMVLSLCPWRLAWLGRPLAQKMSAAHYALSDQTVAQALDSIGLARHTPLRDFLTYLWGDYGLTPAHASWAIHCMVANHYFNGARFPIGGTGEIARRIIPTIEAHGGRVLVRAPVEKLIVEDGRCVGVRLRRGERRGERREVRARDGVVSAAGAYNTFMRMVPEGGAAAKLLAEPRDALADRAITQPSCSHLMLFVALNGASDELRLVRDQRPELHTEAFFAALPLLLRRPCRPLTLFPLRSFAAHRLLLLLLLPCWF